MRQPMKPVGRWEHDMEPFTVGLFHATAGRDGRPPYYELFTQLSSRGLLLSLFPVTGAVVRRGQGSKRFFRFQRSHQRLGMTEVLLRHVHRLIENWLQLG